MFLALRRGIDTLVDALARSLPPQSLRLGTPALEVLRYPDGDPRGPWAVRTEHSTFEADELVLTGPTHRAAELLRGTAPGLSDALSRVPYTSAATVFFALPKGAVERRLDGTGFVVPRRESMEILASTWVSSKWPDRAPLDATLVRVFVGGSGHEGMLDRPDDELAALGLREFRRLVPLRAEPLFSRVFRFRRQSPLPTVGHLERVERIRAELTGLRGLHLVGSAYEGVGIPDVIRLAERTADEIIAAQA